MKRPQGIRWPTSREAALLMRALVAILRVRLYLLRGSHHALRRIIEAHPLPREAQDAPPSELAEIAWSVRHAARFVPGATCLTQASAGQLLLARRGHASTVRLSVPGRTETPGTLAPHAWLIAGRTIVLGGTAAEYAHHRALHDFTLPAATDTTRQ